MNSGYSISTPLAGESGLISSMVARFYCSELSAATTALKEPPLNLYVPA